MSPGRGQQAALALYPGTHEYISTSLHMHTVLNTAQSMASFNLQCFDNEAQIIMTFVFLTNLFAFACLSMDYFHNIP